MAQSEKYSKTGDITVNSITLRKIKKWKPSDPLIIDEVQDTLELFSIENHTNIASLVNIEENIFNPFLSGFIIIEESGILYDKFNFTGEETLEISFETPVDVPEDQEDKTEIVNFIFCIYSSKLTGDVMAQRISSAVPGINTENAILLDFISCEYNLLSNTEIELTDDDYIGKIVSSEDSDTDGLVNVIYDKYFMTPYYAEPTENSVWFRHKNKTYPWGKSEDNESIISVMMNLSENSIPASNTHAPNYLFWRDLQSWNFVSIEYLLGLDVVKKYSPYYGMEDNDGGHPTSVLSSFDVIDDVDILSMFEGGVFNSYYEYIKPNYSNPYHDYMDVSDVIEKENIDFNYFDSFGNWKTVESYPLVSEKSKFIETYNRKIKLNDNIYGYFSPEYNSKFSYHDKYSKDITREGKKQWQCIFDQTDLDHKILKTIKKDIKGQLKDNKEIYRDKLNLNKKWDVYEKSICCHKDEKEIEKHQFLAVIEDAKIIDVPYLQGKKTGIYEYSWREVEIWPKDFIEGYVNNVEILSNDDAPLVVVVPPNGLSGEYQEQQPEWSRPAYNINELMNSVEGDNVFSGPGINAANNGEGDFNDYPEAFQMMPIGGYFLIGDNPCEINHEDVEVSFRKHVVQMYKLPSNILYSIDPQNEDEDNPDPSIPKEIFFFDVPNSHDGLCACPTE